MHIKILILKEIGQKEINTLAFSLLISLNYKKLLSFIAKKEKKRKEKLLELPINTQKSQNILKVIE